MRRILCFLCLLLCSFVPLTSMEKVKVLAQMDRDFVQLNNAAQTEQQKRKQAQIEALHLQEQQRIAAKAEQQKLEQQKKQALVRSIQDQIFGKSFDAAVPINNPSQYQPRCLNESGNRPKAYIEHLVALVASNPGPLTQILFDLSSLTPTDIDQEFKQKLEHFGGYMFGWPQKFSGFWFALFGKDYQSGGWFLGSTNVEDLYEKAPGKWIAGEDWQNIANKCDVNLRNNAAQIALMIFAALPDKTKTLLNTYYPIYQRQARSINMTNSNFGGSAQDFIVKVRDFLQQASAVQAPSAAPETTSAPTVSPVSVTPVFVAPAPVVSGTAKQTKDDEVRILQEKIQKVIAQKKKEDAAREEAERTLMAAEDERSRLAGELAAKQKVAAVPTTVQPAVTVDGSQSAEQNQATKGFLTTDEDLNRVRGAGKRRPPTITRKTPTSEPISTTPTSIPKPKLGKNT